MLVVGFKGKMKPRTVRCVLRLRTTSETPPGFPGLLGSLFFLLFDPITIWTWVHALPFSALLGNLQSFLFLFLGRDTYVLLRMQTQQMCQYH